MWALYFTLVFADGTTTKKVSLPDAFKNKIECLKYMDNKFIDEYKNIIGLSKAKAGFVAECKIRNRA